MSGKVPGSEAGRRQAPERDERQLMRFAERLQELIHKKDDTAGVQQLFNAFNLRLFLQLRKDQLKKRIVKGRQRE